MTIMEEFDGQEFDVNKELQDLGVDPNDVENIEYDNNKVTQVFIDIVEQEAEKRDVAKEEIALCLYPMKKMLSHRTRCAIISLNNSFKPSIVRVKELTPLDTLGHISKAIMLILKDEKKMYDEANGTDADLEKFECYIQIVKGELSLTMAFDKKPIRKFDLQKEFGGL